MTEDIRMSKSLKESPAVVKEDRRERLSLRRVLVIMWRQRALYILLLPAIVLTIVFRYIPVYGLTLAFRDYNAALGPFKSPWTKPIFYNFFFFQDREFWFVLGNTVRIAVLKFVTAWPAPIILALLLNEVSIIHPESAEIQPYQAGSLGANKTKGGNFFLHKGREMPEVEPVCTAAVGRFRGYHTEEIGKVYTEPCQLSGEALPQLPIGDNGESDAIAAENPS